MLDPWIIEEIKKDEAEKEANRPVIHIERIYEDPVEDMAEKPKEERGVTVIDLLNSTA